MIHPLQPIIDGLNAAAVHWQPLLAALLLMLVSQFLLAAGLRKILGDRLTTGEYYSLSLAGWMLPAALIALLWYFAAIILSPQPGILVVVVFVAILGFTNYPRAAKAGSDSTLQVLLILTAGFIVLRLAFVARAIFPLYFDSAQHYIFTRNLLAPLEQPQTGWALTNYYHLGFHFITAFLTYISRASINDNMLILGQMILATLPFPVFFITKHVTRSTLAAIFALLLAGFGWYMPAHAVDWGKYPALASLALFPFTLSMVYLFVLNYASLSKAGSWSFGVISLLGIFVSVLLHSRALIIFGIAAITWALTWIWQRLPHLPKHLLLVLVMLGLLVEIIYIQNKGILGPLFDPYGHKALLVTVTVLVLSVFAYRTYPAVIFACLFAVSLLILSLFLPLTNLIPGYINMTVLDRPYVEMILYLPLTLLGGFGMASLEQHLQAKNFTLSRTVSIGLIVLIMVHALFKYDLYPSDCCDLISQDDLQAIAWMDHNLPADARVVVSSTEVNVLPTNVSQGSAGGDAGTWIPALIDRATILMPFTTDFSQQQTLDTVCQNQARYVYVGKTGWGFNDAAMAALPNAYKLMFEVPNARVYEVKGCG